MASLACDMWRGRGKNCLSVTPCRLPVAQGVCSYVTTLHISLSLVSSYLNISSSLVSSYLNILSSLVSSYLRLCSAVVSRHIIITETAGSIRCTCTNQLRTLGQAHASNEWNGNTRKQGEREGHVNERVVCSCHLEGFCGGSGTSRGHLAHVHTAWFKQTWRYVLYSLETCLAKEA